MEDIITLKMIIDLPQKILNDSKEYQENAILLRKDVYSHYDIKQLKKNIINIFNHYSDVTYLYRFPNFKITGNYEIKENMRVNSRTDQVGDFVTNQIDEQIWVTKFYYRLLDLSKKLTLEETVFLIDVFFRRKTEDGVCEKLGICRNTLRGIRNSCLVKMWIELESLIDD